MQPLLILWGARTMEPSSRSGTNSTEGRTLSAPPYVGPPFLKHLRLKHLLAGRRRALAVGCLIAGAILPVVIPGTAFAQNQLKPEEQAAIVLAAGRKAYNEKQYP